jgi:hypothetical protein
MQVKLILMGVVIVVTAAACAPAPMLRDPDVLRDTSLVTGDPCEAPCFQGITPGETPWNVAVTLIEDNRLFSGVEQPVLADTNARALEFNAAATNKRCCAVFSDDGRVVTSVFALVAPEMTLGQVIERFGEPTYLTGEGIGDDQASIALVYPNVPMILYVFAAGLQNGVLSESSEVFAHVYLTPENMQRALEASSLFAWQGYGRVASMISGDFAITPIPEALRSGATPEAEATAQSDD